MGGTFDPIHLGHLVAAAEVSHRLSLDEMFFVPTGVPWQKQDREVTDAEHRYVMTVLATDRTGVRQPGTLIAFRVDVPGAPVGRFGARA